MGTYVGPFGIVVALVGGFMTGMFLVYLFYLTRLKATKEGLISLTGGIVGLIASVAASVAASGKLTKEIFLTSFGHYRAYLLVYFPIGLVMGGAALVAALLLVRRVGSRYPQGKRIVEKEEWYDVPSVSSPRRKAPSE